MAFTQTAEMLTSCGFFKIDLQVEANFKSMFFSSILDEKELLSDYKRFFKAFIQTNTWISELKNWRSERMGQNKSHLLFHFLAILLTFTMIQTSAFILLSGLLNICQLVIFSLFFGKKKWTNHFKILIVDWLHSPQLKPPNLWDYKLTSFCASHRRQEYLMLSPI